MRWRDRDEQARKLLRLGNDYLDQHEPKKAQRVADRLWKLGNSGAAEVRARAEWMLGNHGDAIRTLEEGTSRWPQVAILWSYLGEYLSNTGSYEAALQAFERAKTGLGGSEEWSEYNCALVLWRMGRAQEALDRVLALPDGGGGPPAATRRWLEASALIDLGRAQEALEAMEFVLEEHEKWVSSDTMSRLLETHARALALVGRAEEALAVAWDAIRCSKASDYATDIIRQTSGVESAGAKEWRIRLRGRWHSPVCGYQEAPEFFASYLVVADDAQEALELARLFEPEEVRSSIGLSEAVVERDAPGEKKGVVRAPGGYTFVAVS